MGWGLRRKKSKEGNAENAPPKVSLITEGMTIRGTVDAKEDIIVKGEVHGDVVCGTFALAETGFLRGDLVALRAQIAGKVEGLMKVGSLRLAGSARIIGDVEYETLQMEAGAEILGQLIPKGAGAGDLKLVAGGPVVDVRPASTELEDARTFGFA
jgi:cytoskeletal protein CcmA (bactofilin family)